MDTMAERPFLIEERVIPGWTFQSAAARFFATRDEFLKTSRGGVGPVGIWELTCFPAKDFLGKKMGHDDIWTMRRLIATFRNYNDRRGKYYIVQGIEKLFKEHLAHPPMPLSMSQDATEVERRAWAVKMYWKRWGFHTPMKSTQ